MFSNTRKHARAYFFPFVKGKGNVFKTSLCKDTMRAFLSFYSPAYFE